MTSIKAVANKILSTGGYILYCVADYAWKQPWDDAATKGRIPIKPNLTRVVYTIVEAHNLREYDYRFLESTSYLAYNKVFKNLRPRNEPAVFVFPLFQEIQKTGFIPAHNLQVKKWIFFTGTEKVPKQKITIPYYRIMSLNEILEKGSNQPAWCAQITLPAKHGKKAWDTGSADGRGHHTVITVIGSQAICIELANMDTANLVALYHELFPHWYDYETPVGEKKTTVVVVTEQQMNQAYDALAKEMQNPATLYEVRF